MFALLVCLCVSGDKCICVDAVGADDVWVVCVGVDGTWSSVSQNIFVDFCNASPWRPWNV